MVQNPLVNLVGGPWIAYICRNLGRTFVKRPHYDEHQTLGSGEDIEILVTLEIAISFSTVAIRLHQI